MACPKSLFVPRDRRLTVQEQADLDEHSRQMFAFMQNKIEDEKLNTLRKEVQSEEKKFFRAQRKQKKAVKKAARSSSRDSGYSSGSWSRPQSQVSAGLVPSSGVLSPTGVLLVSNPFYIGSAPSTTPPAISQPPFKLVRNPFYDPSYVAKFSK